MGKGLRFYIFSPSMYQAEPRDRLGKTCERKVRDWVAHLHNWIKETYGLRTAAV